MEINRKGFQQIKKTQDFQMFSNFLLVFNEHFQNIGLQKNKCVQSEIDRAPLLINIFSSSFRFRQPQNGLHGSRNTPGHS